MMDEAGQGRRPTKMGGGLGAGRGIRIVTVDPHPLPLAPAVNGEVSRRPRELLPVRV